LPAWPCHFSGLVQFRVTIVGASVVGLGFF
jgi:hypothetical protein